MPSKSRPPSDASRHTVAEFSISKCQYLAEDGTPLSDLPAWADDSGYLQELYRQMVLARSFDARAIALQRTGQMGTYGSCLGQEAIGVVLGATMKAEDVLLPTYREYAAQLARGVHMHELLLYWGGDERGMAYQNQAEDFPIAVPIGSQTAHAAGVAYAFKIRKQPRVAVCVLGDGGSSKGDFYEAMNFAGVHCLPVLFLVVNNHWAISVRREQQCAGETLAQKAIAAGFSGEQVDGNDVVALHECFSSALDSARNGKGPRLIEVLTYRLGDHTTADDASRYRPEEEVKAAWQGEPVARLRSLLVARGEWDERRDEALQDACKAEVEAEVKRYLAVEPPSAKAMFEHLYADMPRALQQQYEDAGSRGAEQ